MYSWLVSIIGKAEENLQAARRMRGAGGKKLETQRPRGGRAEIAEKNRSQEK